MSRSEEEARHAESLKRATQRIEDNARRVHNSIANYNKLGKANQTQTVTEGRARLLERYWNETMEASTQIETYATKEDRATLAYFTQSHLVQVEEIYLKTYDFFQEKLASYSHASAGGGSTGTPVGQPHAASLPQSEFKLPTISVPTFSGILTDWIAFRDLFTSLITSRVGLSNVQKLHYLLSFVTDDAAELLSHISLSDDNFRVAWNILKDQYENKRSIINAHLNSFFAIKTVTPGDAVNGLKKLRASSSESINALRALQRPVAEWNDLLVFCLVQKLDKHSRRAWEVHLGDGNEYPTMETLTKFLDTRIRSLEATASIQPIEKIPESSGKKETKNSPKGLRSHHGTASDSCVVCSEAHKISQCEKFKSKSIPERQKYARQNYLCVNCLTKGHVLADCRSSFNCFHCKRRHHSLLHEHKNDRGQATTQTSPNPNPNPKPSTPTIDSKSNALEQSGPNVTHAHVGTQVRVSSQAVLLATAWVGVESDQERHRQARALIDPGSDASFISENLVQCLRLRRENTNAYVASIGGRSVSIVKEAVQLIISPVQDPTKDQLELQALVLSRITAYVPTKVPFDMTLARGMTLADPEPTSSAPIELLLGVDLYAALVLEGIYKEASNKLILQNTIFGWIISGVYSNNNPPKRTIHTHHASAQEVSLELLKFFEVEEVPSRKHPTSAETQCENHFQRTHYRTPEGKYVVRLPFKTKPPISISDTEARSLASYRNLEKKLQRDEDLSEQYSAFLREYRESNHMEAFKKNKLHTQTVFLPHHPVVKDSNTTKLRVVFNASALSTNGTSLNDHLLAGPNLQPELVSVLINWHMFRYVFTSDIAQMFRQISVDPRDRPYQMIHWRFSPEEEIQPFVLNTVTYGTASAPYLAQRVLLQVAEDEGRDFPLAVPILKRQRYMDDLMFGDDSKEGAIQKRTQITDCLARAGLPLRKWASNDSTLLDGIEITNHGLALNLPLEEGNKLKVLGLNWEPTSDCFHIVTRLPLSIGPTKRQILSTIARCFDPLGWLAPVIVLPKILIQQLWLLKIGWDEPVPEPLSVDWKLLCEQLPLLDQISIPRWTLSDSSRSVQVHGFCDASERAYAAGVYLLVRSPHAKPSGSLMLAKTRVVPLKTLTIRRLELCAAVLLIKCISSLLGSISVPVESITCWSDSSVVLCWLKTPPSKLKVFAAHRVAEIQNQLPHANWNHVPSEDNPADCTSRGLNPSQLRNHPLWWHGPQWLTEDPSFWPDQTYLDSISTEVDTKVTTYTHLQTRYQDTENDRIEQLLRNISAWPRLLRVTAYVLRFIERVRTKAPPAFDLALHAEEIRSAENFWIRYAQKENFPQEVTSLTKKLPLSTSSKLKRLDPYLDETGLIRVGGRLQNAELTPGEKHPVVLSNHRISELLIAHVHGITLHGGTPIMLRVLRENFWVLRARKLVRAALHKCARCTRERQTLNSTRFNSQNGKLDIVHKNRITAHRNNWTFVILPSELYAVHYQMSKLHSATTGHLYYCRIRASSVRGQISNCSSQQVDMRTVRRGTSKAARKEILNCSLKQLDMRKTRIDRMQRRETREL